MHRISPTWLLVIAIITAFFSGYFLARERFNDNAPVFSISTKAADTDDFLDCVRRGGLVHKVGRPDAKDDIRPVDVCIETVRAVKEAE